MLAGRDVDVDAMAAALARAAGDVPHAIVSLDEIEPDGIRRSALGLRTGEVCLVRPDAHTAAVVTEPGDLAAAVRRALGH